MGFIFCWIILSLLWSGWSWYVATENLTKRRVKWVDSNRAAKRNSLLGALVIGVIIWLLWRVS
jgi:threonine/homoserine/homoserine lactone efflux protein